MQARTLIYHPLPNPSLQPCSRHCSTSFSKPVKPLTLPRFHFSRFPSKTNLKSCFVRNCIAPSQEVPCFSPEVIEQNDGFEDIISSTSMLSNQEYEKEEEKMLENKSLWSQIKEIIMFTGPATGLWISAPLMSLIDTAVIGQGSSIELAALGPGTVLCDYMSYVFMFLSVATSNMVATSLARKDKKEVQRYISVLLFVGLTIGFCMLFFTKVFGTRALTAFAGPNNAHIIPAANKYIQIRGLAWPAVLVGWVAQSASLGMKDSWGPLKALAVASSVKIVGDIVLCIVLGYGIVGAAWATMVSQVISAYMMVNSLNKTEYNAYAISIPSSSDLLTIFQIAAPVFIMMMSKVAFYVLIIYFATNMGTYTVAAHQVMIQMYSMCTVVGEPLAQAAQSFMPELLCGINKNLPKARMLLKSLVTIGVALGLLLGIFGTSVPWLLPNVFTSDQNVIKQMHRVLVPYFFALAVTPPTLSLEGTLLAGRDLRFVSLSMSGCFSLGAVMLMLVSSGGYGLLGLWFALLGFQWARFFLSLQRLLSPNGMLHSQDWSKYKPEKLKAV